MPIVFGKKVNIIQVLKSAIKCRDAPSAKKYKKTPNEGIALHSVRSSFYQRQEASVWTLSVHALNVFNFIIESSKTMFIFLTKSLETLRNISMSFSVMFGVASSWIISLLEMDTVIFLYIALCVFFCSAIFYIIFMIASRTLFSNLLICPAT